MSSILFIALIICAVFACMYGLSEWAVRARSGASDTHASAGAADLPDAEHCEASNLTALWRVSQRREDEDGSAPDSLAG